MARLPLDTMTRAEKLQAMEDLWQDLAASDDPVSGPDWHGHVLDARAQRMANGDAEYVSFDDVKQRLLAKYRR
jgi:hypothetical protein